MWAIRFPRGPCLARHTTITSARGDAQSQEHRLQYTLQLHSFAFPSAIDHVLTQVMIVHLLPIPLQRDLPGTPSNDLPRGGLSPLRHGEKAGET